MKAFKLNKPIINQVKTYSLGINQLIIKLLIQIMSKIKNRKVSLCGYNIDKSAIL